MTNWHGYLAIEDINLSTAQRQSLWDVLKGRGRANDGPSLQLRNHWRFSLDNKKAIFEALFDQDQLTFNQFKQWLGAIFGVDPATIDNANSQQTFNTLSTPIVTFARGSTNFIRFAIFGGFGATWSQSRIEVIAYLLANQDEWENRV